MTHTIRAVFKNFIRIREKIFFHWRLLWSKWNFSEIILFGVDILLPNGTDIYVELSYEKSPIWLIG